MEGNLYRYINDDRLVTWKCPEHLHRLHGPMNVGAIRNFVSDRGGLVDLQQATIKVDLTSKVEADQFVSLVTSFQHIFDLSIKLNWEVTRSQVVELCVEVTRTRAVVLVIDGIALGIHPQDRVLWMEDLVVQIMEDFDVGYNAPRLGLRLISLLNYPQPQEQFIYTGDCSFHQKMTSERPTYDWVDLQSVLRKFRKSVLEARTVSDSVVVAEELKLAMTKHGLAEVRLINVHNGLWHGVFDLETVALIDVTSSDMTCLRSVVSLGTLCRLTLDLVDPNLDHELYCMMEANPGLQELNISDKECNLLGRIEHILAVRHSSLDPIRITLLERGKGTQGRIVVQLLIGGHDSNLSGGALENQNQAQDSHQAIDCVQWHCDHIPWIRSDFSASLLDRVSYQHSSVLTSFTLDISRLSRNGLFAIQNVLSRSKLERLHVLCSRFDPSLSGPITQALASVQWSTLKALKLSGDHIDTWIRLLMTCADQGA
ncbi:hypothetical protein BGZ74_010564, partial [Mortierella antarctica]